MTSEELGEERRRLVELALPELLAIPWFEKAGRLEQLPKHFGRWEPDQTVAFRSQETMLENRILFIGDLTHHINHWHSAGVWTIERAREVAAQRANPMGNLLIEFDEHSAALVKKISEIGSLYEWWSRDVESQVLEDAAYYAAWFAFEESDNIGKQDKYPDYFFRAMEIYRSGHIPVGWTRPVERRMGGYLIGNFVYY